MHGFHPYLPYCAGTALLLTTAPMIRPFNSEKGPPVAGKIRRSAIMKTHVAHRAVVAAGRGACAGQGRRPELSVAAGAGRGAGEPGRRQRPHRAHPRPGSRRRARPAVRGREPRHLRRHRGDSAGGRVAAGRAHAARDLRYLRHQPLPLQEPAMGPVARLRAGHAGLPLPAGAGGASGPGSEDGARVRGAREGAGREPELRLRGAGVFQSTGL